MGSAEDGYGVAGSFCGGAVSGHRRSCGEGGCVLAVVLLRPE